MHFTNFAILLAGDGCDNGDANYIITWLSLAFVLLALFAVVFAIAWVEFRIRYKQFQFTSELNTRLMVQPSRM